MFIYDIGGRVVNLRSMGKIVTCDRLVITNKAEVIIDVENGKERRYYGVDLGTGLIRNANAGEAGFLFDYNPHLKESLEKRGYKVLERGNKYYTHAEPLNDELIIRLVICLLTHQVRGEQIEQGLKANGIPITIKIREDYLGGWFATQKASGRQYTMATFLNSMISTRMNK
jgi:hypothetical protein